MGPPPERSLERVGLFGGTFDPPHRGHVSVARDVADALELDRVLWIPADHPPHKTKVSLSPAGARLAMAEAASAADPRFEVSSLEIERGGTSYTVDTIRALRARLPDATLFLIIGVDQYRAFDSWCKPREIGAMCRIVVMDRGGESGEDGRADVAARFVPVRRVDLSSTDVRAAVRAGADLSGLVPEGVEEIIGSEGLYRP